MLLAAGAGAAVLTTVGDVVRRRVRDGRLPDPQTVPDEVREVQEELAGLRLAPAVPRSERPAPSLPPEAPRRTGRGRGRRRGAHRLDRVGGPNLGEIGLRSFRARPRHRPGRPGRWRSSAGTSSTTGTTGSCTRAATCGPIHVVHHSSERYNLSTALRQPVADALGTFASRTALLAPARHPARADRAGPRRSTCSTSTGSTPRRSARLGPFETVLNTPSHHRVHHGIATGSTSTATTAASSSSGTGCSAPSSPRPSRSSTG